MDESPSALSDNALELLCDHTALSWARERLKSQDKSLDIIFQARISAMIRVLNLFLDLGLQYTWREASMIVAKVQGNGPNRAHSVQAWILDFVREGHFPSIHIAIPGQQSLRTKMSCMRSRKS
jgi:hypothetical protein